MKLFIEGATGGEAQRRLSHRLKLKIIRPISRKEDQTKELNLCEPSENKVCSLNPSSPSLFLIDQLTALTPTSVSSGTSLCLVYSSSKSCNSRETKSKLKRKMKFNDKPEKEKKTMFYKGRWTQEEHIAFIEGIVQYGNNWFELQNLIKSRSTKQIRSHSQKLFSKIQSDSNFMQKFKFKNKRISPQIINLKAQSMLLEEIDMLIKAILFIDYNDSTSQISWDYCPNASESCLLSSKRMESQSSYELEDDFSKDKVSITNYKFSSDRITDETEISKQLKGFFEEKRYEPFDDCNPDFFVYKEIPKSKHHQFGKIRFNVNTGVTKYN